jgi:hypothetical protein
VADWRLRRQGRRGQGKHRRRARSIGMRSVENFQSAVTIRFQSEQGATRILNIQCILVFVPVVLADKRAVFEGKAHINMHEDHLYRLALVLPFAPPFAFATACDVINILSATRALSSLPTYTYMREYASLFYSVFIPFFFFFAMSKLPLHAPSPDTPSISFSPSVSLTPCVSFTFCLMAPKSTCVIEFSRAQMKSV